MDDALANLGITRVIMEVETCQGWQSDSVARATFTLRTIDRDTTYARLSEAAALIKERFVVLAVKLDDCTVEVVKSNAFERFMRQKEEELAWSSYSKDFKVVH